MKLVGRLNKGHDFQTSEIVMQSRTQPNTINIFAKGMDLNEKGKTNFKSHIKEL